MSFYNAVVPIETGHKNMVLGLTCTLNAKGEPEKGDLCSIFVERVTKGPLAADLPMSIIGATDEVMSQVYLFPTDDLTIEALF